MVNRIVLVCMVLLLCAVLPALAADELRITVLENKEFKIEGDNVHIIGFLEITKGEVYLTAGEIVYNSEQKTAVLSGTPYLRTEDAEVNGDEIAADFDAEIFTFTGAVRIVQSDRIAQADLVTVDNVKETYLLSGNVVIVEEEDQKELRAGEVLITSEPDVIEVRGPVEVSFVFEDDDESESVEGQGASPKSEVNAGEVYVQVESLTTEPR